ncbi:T-cell activation Rho GTPase-activating protein-like [Polyodon spathula]|uniref:T-cell activation Rho GTPase-activating protein-like n=1 Tax=Polyodon spathula TaxID=7913 RepID=UPI001B7F5AEE|nr:T-cell activation Rho GTPase-activating protein-like [Polyodon spathula]
MKVLSGSTASKTLSGSNMDSFIESALDGDAKTYHSSAPCDSEDGTCHLIEGNKKRKKVLSWRFQLRKSSIQSDSSTHSDPDMKTPLFGQPLSMVCDEDEKLPKPIMDILTLLLKKGTSTEGIFRKAGNAKICKEIKEQLNAGTEVDMDTRPIVLLAAVFKDFLRHIPHSLLLTELYLPWMVAMEMDNIKARYHNLKLVVEKLPRPNILLLQHFLCVLHHISKNSEINKMDARNLAVCIGPNMLLLDSTLSLEVQKEMTEKITTLTQFLIENCCEIFGDNITALFGEPFEEELTNSSETSSSHQHDSAYDSTDPDVDGDSGNLSTKQQKDTGCSIQKENNDLELTEYGHISSTCEKDPPSDIFETFTKRINRRCSEPNILVHNPSVGIKSQKLTRSQGDFSVETEDLSFEDQQLKKQNSDDCFVTRCFRDKKPASLKLSNSLQKELPTTPSSKASSTCSLESTFSNVSDNSVFTSSPLASPSSPKRSFFGRHQSFSARATDDMEKHDKELKKHSLSFSIRNDKKPLFKTKSWGQTSFNRNSLKKDSQKESQFSCDTLQEDSQNEADSAEPQPRAHTTSISTEEVFQQVDSKKPGQPPSYEEAIRSRTSPPPTEYSSMTVQDARNKLSTDRKTRPSSVTENLNSITNSTFGYKERCNIKDSDTIAEKSTTFRHRAMSESISRTRLDWVQRRCSQPLFEDISYAKESYV